jgi:polyhydroxyalkanoate synthase
MRFLAGAGLRTLLLDWGRPGPEEAGFGLADWLGQRLGPALDAVADAAGRPALVGYCLGGAFAVAAAGHAPGRVRRLALLGAPWSFAGGSGVAATLRAFGAALGPERAGVALEALAAAFGAVPAELFQLLFALLDPGLAFAKFRRFAELDQASPEARRFVELEDWLNDPVALPGATARELLVDWQVGDAPARGQWRPFGPPVRPGVLRLPVLAFASERDRIAPPAATLPLVAAIPGARLLRPGTGHVGMIASGAARAAVWEPLREFLAVRDGTSQDRGR